MLNLEESQKDSRGKKKNGIRYRESEEALAKQKSNLLSC